jgi:Fe-S-cluster-containing hydrogenase component 2
VKECPVEAISMDEGLAVIDYAKCTNCGKCVEVCPVNCIHDYRLQHWFIWEGDSARGRQAAAAS